MIARSLLKEKLTCALFTMSQQNNDCLSSFLLTPEVLLQSFVCFSIKVSVSKVSNSQKCFSGSDTVSRFCKFNLFEVAHLWYISDSPPMDTQPRMVLIIIVSLVFLFLIFWPICKVGIAAPIKTEMSLVLEQSRFTFLSYGHLLLT